MFKLNAKFDEDSLFYLLSHFGFFVFCVCVCWRVLFFIFLFSLNIFYWLCYYIRPISPLHSTPSCPPTPSHILPYCSCPQVISINSLLSTFPILFLPSPCLFSTKHLCYLFSVLFPPLSPSHTPIDNPSCDLHFCGSVPVLVVCLVCFCFCCRCCC